MTTRTAIGRVALLLVAAALGAVSTACSDDDESSAGTTEAPTATTRPAPGDTDATPASTVDDSQPQAPAITTDAAFEAQGSIEQAYVTGAEPGARLVVADADGAVAGSGTVNDLGGLIVRDLEPGDGYTFRAIDRDEIAGSEPFAVQADDEHPDATFYGQQLREGLNYVTMRDGVELAVTVRPPSGKTLADGPFPTVIEYSGYATAAPGNILEPDPKVPAPDSSTAVGGVVAPLLGFTSVSVQMRGTGCSGGAFGLFDTLMQLDGYDAIETVAAQPWVKGGKVGMVGISFSGISQLLVAGTQPPHLAAITPLSATDDLYSTGFPGGIRNDGFAASWLAERVEDAKPAPQGGQEWAKTLIEQGDERCAANQVLHGEALSLDSVIGDETARVPDVYDERSPAKAAERIEVPTFLVGAVQDEQTGGQWPNLVPALDDNDDVWVTLLNGTHVDSLGPGTIGRWLEFLDLYVADQLPTVNAGVLGMSGTLYQLLAGAPAAAVPPVRFGDAPSVDVARKEFADDPRIRVLFENGGGDPEPGALAPQWEAGFDSWPPPDVTATDYSFASNGVLTPESLSMQGEVAYRPDPAARPAVDLPEGDPWSALPPYVWAPVTGGTGLGFTSDPLEKDVVVAGPASVDLTMGSTATDTDIQVTVSEVRPDGQEMYVQSGFLRASHRALDPQRSSDLVAAPTFAPADAAPLEQGTVNTVRVPIAAITHAFRAGSRIRVTITAPGGDRPAWTFDTPKQGNVTNTIVIGGPAPSKLVLPIVDDVAIPASEPLPPCPSLRGQPCRSYEPAGNGG